MLSLTIDSSDVVHTVQVVSPDDVLHTTVSQPDTLTYIAQPHTEPVTTKL